MNQQGMKIKKNLLHKLMAEMDRQDAQPHHEDNPMGQGHNDPVATLNKEGAPDFDKDGAKKIPHKLPQEKGGQESGSGWGKSFVSKNKFREMRKMR